MPRALEVVLQTWNRPRDWVCFFDDVFESPFSPDLDPRSHINQLSVEENLGWVCDFSYVYNHTYDPTHLAHYHGCLDLGSWPNSDRLDDVDIMIEGHFHMPPLILYQGSLEFSLEIDN